MSASHSDPPGRSGFLPRPDGHRLAWSHQPGNTDQLPIVWLCGFGSGMDGTKAAHLAQWATNGPRDLWRMDYFGCGRSSGAFHEGSIGRWSEDVLAFLDQLVEGPIVLAGSSMGAWIALLAQRARPEKIRGLFLLAPAPDFTDKLLPAQTREEICKRGSSDSREGGGPITRKLLEEARTHLLMDSPLPLACPVHILHGMEDQTVPLAHVLELARLMHAPGLTLTLIGGGDHRLSTPDDLDRMTGLLEGFCREIDAASASKTARKPSR